MSKQDSGATVIDSSTGRVEVNESATFDRTLMGMPVWACVIVCVITATASAKPSDENQYCVRIVNPDRGTYETEDPKQSSSASRRCPVQEFADGTKRDLRAYLRNKVSKKPKIVRIGDDWMAITVVTTMNAAYKIEGSHGYWRIDDDTDLIIDVDTNPLSSKHGPDVPVVVQVRHYKTSERREIDCFEQWSGDGEREAQ